VSILVRAVILFLIVGSVLTIGGINSIFTVAYGQSVNNDTSSNNATAGGGFNINIRGISSFTEPNMVALISTENEVQAKKVDLDKAIIQPGEEKSYSPNKMIDFTIQMNKPVKPNTEVMACVLQLGSTDFSQRVKCNTVFSESRSTGEPQKIIVPL
jgi:hypothetical protein